MEGHPHWKHGKAVLVSTLFGAAGFGIGGLAGGVLWLFGEDTAVSLLPVGLGTMGAIGGASLALMNGGKRAGLVALSGGLGFLLGTWPVLIAAATALTEQYWYAGKLIPAMVALLLLGGVQGVVGTAATFLVLKPGKSAGWLLGAAALGFGVGAEAALATSIGLPGGVVFAIWGVVGGGVLGAAFGHWQIAGRAYGSEPVSK